MQNNEERMVAGRTKTISDKIIAATLWVSAAYIAIHVDWLRQLLMLWFGLSLPFLAVTLFHWFVSEQRALLRVPALVARPVAPIRVIRSANFRG
jgi:hypothetical protein